MPSLLNNNLTISVLPLSAALINTVSFNLWIKFHILLEILNYMKKDKFEYHECICFKMSVLLILMPSCLNNNSTISL